MAPEPIRITEPVKFGKGYELDVRAYELRRSGRPLKLERIPMELLVLLVELRGQLVSGELLGGSPISLVIALRSCESGLSLTFGMHPVPVKRWEPRSMLRWRKPE